MKAEEVKLTEFNNLSPRAVAKEVDVAVMQRLLTVQVEHVKKENEVIVNTERKLTQMRSDASKPRSRSSHFESFHDEDFIEVTTTGVFDNYVDQEVQQKELDKIFEDKNPKILKRYTFTTLNCE